MEFNYDDQHIFSEFEDPERKRLIGKIHNIHPELAEVPRELLYPIWFADLKILKKLAATGEDANGAFDKLETSTGTLYNVPLICTANKSGPFMEILKNLKLQSRRRASFKCALTGAGILDTKTCYIIPSALQGKEDDSLEKEGVWGFLENFWGKEKVLDWKGLLLKNSAMGSRMELYTPFNVIDLDMYVQRLWAMALVALRPIAVNRDRTEMQIALHWLPLPTELGNIKRSDKVFILQNPYQDIKYRPVEIRADMMGPFILLEDGTLVRVSSGHILTVRTDDPDARPLPSFGLLELRWHLSRIVAFQGAGEDEESRALDVCKYDPESDSDTDRAMNEF
ncbi:unnamed protein product [Penicillium olsonii]|uniref:Uncharacterized protein n=1 Tax=Penicillium olsonii TaxID=99116 RepID=A0A9W4MMM1_PENOL|nr:unnamed protein product [Penicillium olsonii]